MYISEDYKYRVDGIVYVGPNPPEGAEILETMTMLNAEDGYYLIRIIGSIDVGSSVWLKDGDVAENYIEREYEDEDEVS